MLAVACMAAALPAAVVNAQQDAGDQQYQDPFAGSSKPKSGSSKPKSGSQQQTTTTPSGELTPSPQTSGTGSSSSGSGSSSTSSTQASTTPTTPSAAALPNTGIDARVLVLAGAALLLTGVGLRMRNAPERF
jgi:LPXTG-motif cell wall-anchored protein